MLTGNPRINGVLIPQPQYEGDGDGRFMWTADHLWFDGREGRILRSLRFGGEITFGWQHLKTPAFNKIVAALALETPVRFVPATRRKCDPDAEENEYLCELTSPLPVYGAGDVATNLHSLSVTLKATRKRESRGGIASDALAYDFGFGEGQDLLAGVPGEGGGSTKTWRVPVRAYQGELLRLESEGASTIRFLGEGVISERTLPAGGGSFEVPAGALTLQVEAPEPRPSLYLDADGYVLEVIEEDEGSVTLRIHPASGVSTSTIEAVSPLTGEPIAIPTYTDVPIPEEHLTADEGHYVTVSAPVADDC